MENTIQRNRTLGQSTWVDYIRRDMLTSGELDELIATGVTGLTSNPTIFEKAIAGSALYDSALDQLAGGRKSPAEIFEALAIEDIGDAADALRSVYDSTNGADGYASIEVDPTLAHDTVGTVSEARRLWARLQRPNVLIKVPATPEGIPAITQLIGAGINVNVTLIFALDAYRQVMDAHIAGIETLVRGGGDPSRVASVASFFVSRVDYRSRRAARPALGAGREQRRRPAGQNCHRERSSRLRAVQGAVRQARFPGVHGQGSARAASALGQHQHQRPCLP